MVSFQFLVALIASKQFNEPFDGAWMNRGGGNIRAASSGGAESGVISTECLIEVTNLTCNSHD
jgi:hypothetical protein